MSKLAVPVKNPKPDITRFLKAMSGDIAPEKPPFIEYLVDDALMKPIIEEMLGMKWVDAFSKVDNINSKAYLDKENIGILNSWINNQIFFWYHMGYDFVRLEVSLPFQHISHSIPDTAEGNIHKDRVWQSLTQGVINNWEDFYNYPWPGITDDNFYIHNYICEHLPEGMGFITCHAGGLFEQTSRLFGYENLCINLVSDESLVKAVVDKIGGIIFEYYKYLLKLDKLSAILQGEDMGFNTQTLISPNDLRKYFLPWHKKYAELCHENNIPYYFHSCGKIDAIMDDLINNVKIDGKHSFQDTVFPIIEAKKLYGEKICLLGGVDVDKLSRLEEEDLRKYIRNIINNCAPNGRFAIGSGNSIPSYVPLRNYLVMLDETLK